MNLDGRLAEFARLCLDPAACPALASERGAEVLREYLFGAYRRAAEEGKVAEAPGCAAFDTGLADRSLRRVYAVFDENPLRGDGLQDWRFMGLAAPGAGRPGRRLAEALRVLPEPLEPRESPEDYRYDRRAGAPLCRLGHVFFDHPERLPRAFLAGFLPPGLIPAGFPAFPAGGLEPFRSSVEAFLRGDDEARGALLREFRKALGEAAARQGDPYWAALPFRNLRRSKVQLLLPVTLGEGRPSGPGEGRPAGLVALVSQRRQAGGYIGITVFTLAMVFQKLRPRHLKACRWLRDCFGPGRDGFPPPRPETAAFPLPLPSALPESVPAFAPLPEEGALL
jgi:hypothetical protein